MEVESPLAWLAKEMSPKKFAALNALLAGMPPEERERDGDDMVQEACVAYLEDKDPVKAANRWRMNEHNYRNHHISFSQVSEAEREELADRIDIPAPPDQPK